MISHIVLYSSVALSLFGTAIATPHPTDSAPASESSVAALPGKYTSFEAYTEDLTDCINVCWADIWGFISAVCDDDDMKCGCLIPEPNLDDPMLATEFGKITDCSTECGGQDILLLQAASEKYANTCKPYLDQYGPIPPANHDYYINALAKVQATNTAQLPDTTEVPSNSTVYPVVTSSATPSENENGNGTALVPTPTNSVAVVTANAAAVNGRWEMPMLVAFVMGVGARLL